jgi:serine carboxypeptidase 1
MAVPYYRPLALLLPLVCLGLLHADSAASITAGTPDGSELWGYVEVRPSTYEIFLHFSVEAICA